MTVYGVPVIGRIAELPAIAAERGADIEGIAVPSATAIEMERMLALAQETEARIQVLPSLAEITSGKASLRLRSIRLEDLLNRPPSTEGDGADLSCLSNRTVLVTGGAGSIGSELCRQLIESGPKRVIALDNNETGIFQLERDLVGARPSALVTVLSDITDVDRMRRVFERYHPDVVFHAAAYKHVPMLEAHPYEAVFVNVVGTQNLCNLACTAGCERFIFISTDKAVEPKNALGYSKRIGELLLQAHGSNKQGKGTRFSSVRFGNVIGSRGSALPEFIRQIDEGGPVTVTHEDAERYFMTIPEAVSLVIRAGTLAGRSPIFMLDMGEPIRISELVRRLIRLRGLRVGKDIDIEYTGLWPGEKMT
jgi:FlaA1/EpsC-like NDP-sugar epimerase